MSVIKGRRTTTYSIIGVIFFVIAYFIINYQPKDVRIVNDIKESYVNKGELDNHVIEYVEELKKKKVVDPDKYFILGYFYLFVEDSEEVAYEYFEKVIKNIENSQADFTKIYSYKFLEDKAVREKNYDLAFEYARKAVDNIPYKKYGEYGNRINDILRSISEIPGGKEVTTEIFEKMLLENHIYMDKKTEFYICRNLQY